MAHTITAGQTYRTLRPHPYGPARITITAHEPGAATADGVDPDTGAPCVVLAADLYPSAYLPTGDRLHDGYALTPEPTA